MSDKFICAWCEPGVEKLAEAIKGGAAVGACREKHQAVIDQMEEEKRRKKNERLSFVRSTAGAVPGSAHWQSALAEAEKATYSSKIELELAAFYTMVVP